MRLARARHRLPLRGGRLREVADESEEQPGQHEQGGWSQARYQRHIDHLVQQHLKTVGARGRQADPTTAACASSSSRREEMRGDFESALSKEARDAIIGWATAEAHAGPKELLEIVRPLLDEAQARVDQEALERFEEAHGRGERAAAGLEAGARCGVRRARRHAARSRRARDRAAGSARSAGAPRPTAAAARSTARSSRSATTRADLALHQTLAHGGAIVRVGAGALGGSEGHRRAAPVLSPRTLRVDFSGVTVTITRRSPGWRYGYLSSPRYFWASLSMCSNAPSSVILAVPVDGDVARLRVSAGSTVTETRGSRRRWRSLARPIDVLKMTCSPSVSIQTGVACGEPSSRSVTTVP